MRADGKCPIWVRISDRDSDRYISLGIFVRASQWNPRKRRVRRSHPNSDQINRLLVGRLSEAEDEMLRICIQDSRPTAKGLKTALTKDSAADLYGFARNHLSDLERRGKISRYRRLKATIDKFRDFAGAPLTFDQITPELLGAFQTHCLKLGNKQSTVATNLSDIRSLYNRAEREDLTQDAKNPFRRFRIEQGDQPDRLKLTLVEIERLGNLDIPAGSRERVVRDVFLFAFYTGGLRFGDVISMRRSAIRIGQDDEPNRLAYRAGKTGKRAFVKLTSSANQILNTYSKSDAEMSDLLFPLLREYDLSTPRSRHNAISSCNTVANKALKRLASQAGIINEDGSPKAITTHVARHSFADYARKRTQDHYAISKMLQHSKLETTERYLASIDSGAMDDLIDAVFEEADDTWRN